jgi:hypothetical protein
MSGTLATLEVAPMEQQQHLEWMAWRSFCANFDEATGADINEPEFHAMVDAVRRWGEELTLLRNDYPLPVAQLAEVRRIAPIHRSLEDTHE